MSNIKVICFDYYGTLVNLNNPFNEIKQWIVKEWGQRHNVLYRKFIREYSSLLATGVFIRGEDVLNQALETVCNKNQLFFPREHFQRFVRELFITPSVYEDTHEVIASLQKKYKVGILSNADNVIIQKSIWKQQIKVNFLITSEDAEANKPDPAIFMYAAEKLHVRTNEMLMVGDSIRDDILGAQQAGLSVIWINRTKTILEKENLLQVNTVSSLIELLAVLE